MDPDEYFWTPSEQYLSQERYVDGYSMSAVTEILQRLYTGLVELIVEELIHVQTPDGVWEEITEFIVLYPAALAVIWIIFSFLYVLLREWRLPYDKEFEPSVAVVVPAHNEELLIERTIEALLDQNYPSMQLHVVSDGSIDGTVEIVNRFAHRGVVLHDLKPNRGKSKALQYMLDRVDTDLYMVVDADTSASPCSIRYMVQQFIDPRIGAVTGHPRVDNVTNLLTAIQAMEYQVIVSMAKRAEQFWGGLYTVSGAAACFRTDALRSVGGWSVRTATEDIEVSWSLQKAGWVLAYEPRALFRIQAPSRLGPLYRQRRRWAQGMCEVFRLHGNLARTKNVALIPISVQVVATGSWILLMTMFLMNAVVSIVRGSFDFGTLAGMYSLAWYSVLFWTIGLFALQAFAACVFDGTYFRGYWKTFPLFILYPLYYWIIVYPSFVLGAGRGLITTKAGQWQRTERTVDVTDATPKSSPRNKEIEREY